MATTQEPPKKKNYIECVNTIDDAIQQYGWDRVMLALSNTAHKTDRSEDAILAIIHARHLLMES